MILKSILLVQFLLFFWILPLYAATPIIPKEVLHKSYATQIAFIDSIVIEKRYLNQDEFINAYKDYEQAALLAGDRILASLLKSTIYRKALDREYLYPNMEELIQNLMKDCEQLSCAPLQADAFQLLADYYWLQKNYVSALEHYYHSRSIYQDLNPKDFPVKSEYLHTFGSRFFYFRDYQTAKSIFLNLWQTIPPAMIQSKISKINTLALCYSNLAEYDSAIYYFKFAESILDTTKEKVWMGIISGNLGNCYYQMGQYDQAIPLLQNNIELSEQNNELADMAFALSTLGDIYLKTQQNEKALGCLLKAYSIVVKKNLFSKNHIVSKIYIPLGKAYAAIGNMHLAYRFLDSGRIAKESMESQRNVLQLTGAQQKIELEKHKAEINRKETELIHKSQFIKNLSLGIGGLMIMLLIILLQYKKIEKEKSKSESLLLNILPAETAAEIIAHGAAKAKNYQEVTVMFTDFKDFTKHSENMEAQDLVNEIHECFSKFDEITGKYGIEKIKTIGDSYMSVCGLPQMRSDHAIIATQAALEIIDYIHQLKSQRIKENKAYFEIRIGLHSGPVVAGIVGIKKFAYDIWGDTVNIAARMEASSFPGKVNISGATYQRIQSHFNCSYRGKIDAKNKGEIDMYFVEASRS